MTLMFIMRTLLFSFIQSFPLMKLYIKETQSFYLRKVQQDASHQ
ncbi:hypothetical protein B4119_1751 [Parageobacillus caldoxylosilyticus]|uniref:Uncharacterized protein n=1 Tax=Saccharococcus caldoxylosilyticus TaxID=81408 RepID=A0A150M7J4_9BACL|nr:hypothetical protein B4119_1751 [Parageobacillus caldoxylosilyticus]